MEPDEDVNENLKMQFKALQEQQQKRAQNLMEKKKEKQQSLKNTLKDGFGTQGDDLSLGGLDSQMSKEEVSKR